MSEERFNILVLPSGLRFSAEKGSNLLEQLGLHDIAVPSPCGGGGTCGKCSVWTAPWTPDQPVAAKTLEQCREICNLQEHLACQVPVDDHLVLWVAPQGKTRVHTDVVAPVAFSESISSTVQSHLFHPRDNGIPDAKTDLELLENEGITSFSLDQIQDMSSRLRNADWKGRLIAFDGRLIAFQPENTPEIRFALAFDLGTTTLALSLLDFQEKRILATVSRHNPQSRFGDDVITRLQKASESDDARTQLRQVVLDALGEMIAELAEETQIQSDRIAALAVAGNTVMQQLFCGLDSTWLGFSPFTPVLERYPLIRAQEWGMAIHPFGLIYLLPILGGFVGGDITAGILATDMLRNETPSLLIDVGTNGEMVLRHEDRLLCAATAAGPAFEGARIQHGMMAAPGAIEKVSFDPVTGDLDIRTIDVAPVRGICGSGLIDLVAELIRLRVILPNGRLVTKKQADPQMPAPIVQRLSEEENNRFFTVDEKQGIVLTQRDIRQLQLAAGAIRSGIVLLLREAGLQQEGLKTVYLAGGFGNYIRRENARQLGILPIGIPTERILFSGNTSLAGAKQVLLDRSQFELLEEIRKSSRHIDLSRFPDFQTVFAESMIFPCDQHYD